jgi:prepilin-type N-terminal cleavage/methylation domain-containing protein
MSAKKAFTLVELLVVIAIIALLISILAPSLQVAKDITKQMICGTNLHAIGVATVIYAEGNAGALPPHCSPKSAGGYFVIGNMSYAPIYNAVSGTRPAILLETYRLSSGSPYLDSAGKPVPWGPAGVLYYYGMIENANLLYCPAIYENQLNRRAYPEPYGTRTSSEGGYGGDTLKSSYPYNPNIIERSAGLADYMYTKMEVFPGSAILVTDPIIHAGWGWSYHRHTGQTSPTWVRGFVGGTASARTSAGLYTFLNSGVDTWNNWPDHVKALDYIQD